jgi:hypothetical protein
MVPAALGSTTGTSRERDLDPGPEHLSCPPGVASHAADRSVRWARPSRRWRSRPQTWRRFARHRSSRPRDWKPKNCCTTDIHRRDSQRAIRSRGVVHRHPCESSTRRLRPCRAGASSSHRAITRSIVSSRTCLVTPLTRKPSAPASKARRTVSASPTTDISSTRV